MLLIDTLLTRVIHRRRSRTVVEFLIYKYRRHPCYSRLSIGLNLFLWLNSGFKWIFYNWIFSPKWSWRVEVRWEGKEGRNIAIERNSKKKKNICSTFCDKWYRKLDGKYFNIWCKIGLREYWKGFNWCAWVRLLGNTSVKCIFLGLVLTIYANSKIILKGCWWEEEPNELRIPIRFISVFYQW